MENKEILLLMAIYFIGLYFIGLSFVVNKFNALLLIILAVICLIIRGKW